MKSINKKIAFELYENKINKLEADKLVEEIKYIFDNLTERQILNLLESKQINLLAECGIDEARLYEIIEKISDGEYYIDETYVYNNSHYYWDDDYDYLYNDIFDILPTLEEAVEYCYILFEKGDYKKALKIGKKLLSLKISFKSHSEYDDNYDDVNDYSLDDCFRFLGYKIDMERLKYLMFSIIVNKEYSYNEIVWVLNKFSHYELDDFSVTTIFVENNLHCIENIKRFLRDNIKRRNLKFELIPLLLKFVDDEKLFKEYAYDFTPISSRLFEKYYEFIKEKGLDTSKIIKDAMLLLPHDETLEKFAKLAIELDDTNDEYKIALYKSNSYEIVNFFELYSMNDYGKINQIVIGDFHKALATLKDNFVFKLPLDELLYLIEGLMNKFYKCDYSPRTLSNIENWREAQDIGNVYLNKLYEHALNKLDVECGYILGKERSLYSFLATSLYRLDCIGDFSNDLKYEYMSKYKKYRSFMQEIDKVYYS